MKKAIIVKWECVACGNVIETRQVLTTNQKKSKYSFETANRCSCGSKGNFKLLTFKAATAVIKEDNEE